jgi:threonine/homoserine/homoserine lactone efflux protein
MSSTVLLWFVLTEFLLSLTPGPAVLLVISQGLKYGASSSIRGSLGILTGNVVYFTVSAAGVGAVLITSEVVFNVIKWSGAAYLVYLGTKMMFEATIAEVASKAEAPAPGNWLFLQGLLTQLANPKALIFFTALLPQFIDPAGPVAWQCGILGVASILVEFPVLVGYGWVAGKGHRIVQHRFFVRWLDRVAGAFLISAGIRLALERRT